MVNPGTGDLESPSSNSEIMIIDDRVANLAAAATATPAVSTLNVTKSSQVHIGPKFVSVTQNVHNNEIIKGRLLGLELKSKKRARRIRCSVAVFVCWAFIVAVGLITYLVLVAAPTGPVRLDIELPIHRYVWDVIKNSSRTERLTSLAALIILVACITLVVHYSLRATGVADNVIDRAPHEWNISREMWLSQHFITNYSTEMFDPLMLVIVHHSVSPECPRYALCAAELRSLQAWFIAYFGYDIPYNYVIGNDGRVYEARGWGIEGAHTLGYNRCSVGVGFIGDYREEINHHTVVTPEQLNRTKMILEDGVRRGYLRPDYLVVGARDLRLTASPGSNLYNAIREWDNYDHENRFANMTCTEIHEKWPLR